MQTSGFLVLLPRVPDLALAERAQRSMWCAPCSAGACRCAAGTAAGTCASHRVLFDEDAYRVRRRDSRGCLLGCGCGVVAFGSCGCLPVRGACRCNWRCYEFCYPFIKDLSFGLLHLVPLSVLLSVHRKSLVHAVCRRRVSAYGLCRCCASKVMLKSSRSRRACCLRRGGQAFGVNAFRGSSCSDSICHSAWSPWFIVFLVDFYKSRASCLR